MLVTSHALRAARTLTEYAALPDNDLVRAMALRDQMALRVLMVRHQLRIGRFLRRFIADRDLAEQALLLKLVYYCDKSIKEAASLAGITEDAVKSRMFQARRKLAAMLAAAEATPQPVSLVPSSTPPAHDCAGETLRKKMTARQL